MNDAVRRGLRTLLWCIGAAIPSIPGLAWLLHLDALTVAGVTTLFTSAVATLTVVVNHLEDTGTIPAVLKAPRPAPPEVPGP